MTPIQSLPAPQRAVLEQICSARAAWRREESLLRAGAGPETLPALQAADLLARWDVPRRRADRPPMVLWTLTPWGAAVVAKGLDERPFSEVPHWRDAVEDLAALGPIRIAGRPGECRLPHPERLPDLREALAREADDPAEPPGTVQATDPVSGRPWELFAQRFPVMVDRRIGRQRKPARKAARKGC